MSILTASPARHRGLSSGLVPLLVLTAGAAALVLDLDWSHAWPAFLILAGASMRLLKRARF